MVRSPRDEGEETGKRRIFKLWDNWDMDCVCVLFRGWMGKTKYLSAFERSMEVGARCTVLSVSRTAMLLGFLTLNSSCVYHEWSTAQRTSSKLDTTVEYFWHLVASMPRLIDAVLRAALCDTSRFLFPAWWPCPPWPSVRLFGSVLRVLRSCLDSGAVLRVLGAGLVSFWAHVCGVPWPCVTSSRI